MALHDHLARVFDSPEKHYGKGKKFNFHGSFDHKSEAVKREREIDGAFILKRGKRFVVVTRKGE